MVGVLVTISLYGLPSPPINFGCGSSSLIYHLSLDCGILGFRELVL